MMKQIKSIFFFFILCSSGYAQNKEVKNVILMIPDGTSQSVITLARWYKAFTENSLNDSLLQEQINKGGFPPPLCFEEHLTGLVSTHSANGFISESASAATAMATGKKSDPGYLGLSYDQKPCVTNMELARIQKKKSTGLVFTCEFTHATPAAFVSHCTSRKDYPTIKKQMIYNQMNVVFGGGYGGHKMLLPKDKKTLENIGYAVYNRFDDVQNFNGEKVWGLFNTDTAYNGYLAFDLDRQSMKINEPSLADMTGKAIQLLEKNKNGFFLMVEGSKVDWAAHANDPVGIVTEFLAFEKAVNLALDYAKKNKNTVVIICTDHGNGGFSIGNRFSEKRTNYLNNPKYIQYNYLPYKTIIDSLMKYPLTGDGFERKLEQLKNLSHNDSLNDCFKKCYAGYSRHFVVSDTLTAFDSVRMYFNGNRHDRVLTSWMGLNDFVSENAYIGWTTKGHTGEDIPLYIYHPNGFTLQGTVDNTMIAGYIADVMGLIGMNDHGANNNYFAALDLKNTSTNLSSKDSLTFIKGKDKYVFLINTNLYYKNGIKKELDCLNVKIGNTFYTSKELVDILE